jgi:hypothetical protein
MQLLTASKYRDRAGLILVRHCGAGVCKPARAFHMFTVEYLSFGSIENIKCFCDLSVREKDCRSRARGAKAT